MAKQPFYKIQNNGDKTVDILIYGVIGDSWYDESISAKRFVSEFNTLEKEYDRINIRINSPGGSVFDGLPIYNAIANSKVDTHTYNEGLAASMAALILLAGKTVHSANNALFMLHSPSTGAWGNARDIKNVLDALDKVQQSLITCLVDKTGKERKDVEAAWFDYNDHWFTADEAKEEGFIDVIDEKRAKVPENIAAMSFQEVMNRFEKIVPPEKATDKVRHWISNLFSIQNNQNDFSDMDPKLLRDAFKLGEQATEEEILNHINNVVAENASLKEGKTKAETDLDAVKAEKEKVEKEFEEFKNSAGAESASTNNATDDLNTDDEDKPAEDFYDAFSTCMDILHPAKK